MINAPNRTMISGRPRPNIPATTNVISVRLHFLISEVDIESNVLVREQRESVADGKAV
jgi:hypothetical protein